MNAKGPLSIPPDANACQDSTEPEQMDGPTRISFFTVTTTAWTGRIPTPRTTKKSNLTLRLRFRETYQEYIKDLEKFEKDLKHHRRNLENQLYDQVAEDRAYFGKDKINKK